VLALLVKTFVAQVFYVPTRPPRRLWVTGDSRGDSRDSRLFGSVPESHVVGRTIWRVWPPDRLSFL
jgi:signal peptidase I